LHAFLIFPRIMSITFLDDFILILLVICDRLQFDLTNQKESIITDHRYWRMHATLIYTAAVIHF
jgi:hypothetical protein